MSIQFADSVADAVNTLPEPYNITSSNNQFSVSIDGGSAQVFTLTNGSARTAAQIVTDLSGLAGATASVCTINGINYVRIRDGSSLGLSSTILFNSPSNNSNTILGFVSGGNSYQTYTGGSVVANSFIGDTKQDLASGIEDNLVASGWITVSGHHSSSIVCMSSCSPASQNLRMQVTITTTNSNTVGISLQNVSGSKVGANGNSNGTMLLPAAGKGFKMYGNKYQAFIVVPGSVQSRDYAAFGVPFIPTSLQGAIWEAMWLQGNAASDSDVPSQPRISFRTRLACSIWNGTEPSPSFQHLCNGNLVDQTSDNSDGPGYQSLASTQTATYMMAAESPGSSLWHDMSAVMSDPLIGWGLTGVGDTSYFRGQLWNAFVSNDGYPCETTINSLDSHNWVAITHNNFGAGGNNSLGARGTLFVTIT
jgi:hypothetical protein